ncbi:hybrid sensor histidine kinase/response regulator [Solitalea sp. MAHUQ-68]|uniref:histidine kinase n=1 Tax=Solitalea agri TaxID=2953739 RepID=A0A9X2F772_9SPHI|nr:hybrid sensor histidine kinase/response regulator [Solitalea agri]MCO4291973.1 hybrid sensor histidine kinase/response regulator [Solitalea agri]
MRSLGHDIIRILYIDDERENLNAFKAAFRREFEIYTVQSAFEAHRILQEVSIHVIIADQRMPNCTGVEFFGTILERFPDPIRILITGYIDSETLIEAINSGRIYRFLRKPWDELELRNTIYNAYNSYQTAKQLKQNIEELEKTNNELSRFIYSMSHDLRSPLMSILGIVKLANLEQSVTDPNGYLDIIAQSVHKLDAYILKVIEYYQNSKAEVVNECIDFECFVNGLLEEFKPQNNGINYRLDVEQSANFKGDHFHIAVIFNNLISNAVKYQRTEESSQQINISIKADEIKAVISIVDNGIGILNEHLDQIFKLFFRAKNTRRTGTGIGLYIVKDALNKIGGSISVQSIINEGTKFEISIPNRVIEGVKLCV